MNFIRLITAIFSIKIKPKYFYQSFLKDTDAKITQHPSYKKVVEEIEDLRITRLRNIVRSCRLYLILISVFFAIFDAYTGRLLSGFNKGSVNGSYFVNHFAIIFTAVFSFIILFPLLVRSQAKEFRIAAETKLASEIVKFYGDNFTYKNLLSFAEEDLFEKFKIFPISGLGIRSRFTKYICGQYNKSNFEFVDVYIGQNLNIGYPRIHRTVFKGIVFVSDYKKDFDGEIVLAKNPGVLPSKIRSLKWVSREFLRNSGLRQSAQKIEINDAWFSENFILYADNPEKIHQIITPSFINVLKEMQLIFSTKRIGIRFCDHKILFAFDRTKLDFNYKGSVLKPSNLVEESKAIMERFNLAVLTAKILDS